MVPFMSDCLNSVWGILFTFNKNPTSRFLSSPCALFIRFQQGGRGGGGVTGYYFLDDLPNIKTVVAL